MPWIGIIGSPTCHKQKKVQELIFKISRTFGNTATILSGGNAEGVEKDVKKYALKFELPYIEFNPSYTGQNLYSAEPAEYYGKRIHPTHFIHRYEKLIYSSTHLFIGMEDGIEDKLLLQIKKKAEKLSKKVVVF